MTKFERCDRDFTDLCSEAITRGARDGGRSSPADFEQAFAGYVNGMSCQGQRASTRWGSAASRSTTCTATARPGSSALHPRATRRSRPGMNECVLAFGFEKMEKGPLDCQLTGLEGEYDEDGEEASRPSRPRMFGDGGPPATWSSTARRKEPVREGVGEEPPPLRRTTRARSTATRARSRRCSRRAMIYDPLTLLQCCPTSDGAGAAILCSAEYAAKHGHSTPGEDHRRRR